MNALRVETLTFPEAERERWRNGSDEMLENSSASPSLKRVLIKKHRVRPRRFFGAAFVASHLKHDAGWYCPFKWLKSSKWIGDTELQSDDQVDFRSALAKYFPLLRELHSRAPELLTSLGGSDPVGPDLWLIVNGEHRFIEVKLPGDKLASHQLAGLALLAHCLPSAMPVSVSVITLDNSLERFGDYAARLTVRPKS